MVDRFQRGDEVILRYVSPIHGFERASIGRILEDSSDRSIVYVAAGSAYVQPDYVESKSLGSVAPSEFREYRWTRYSMLRIMYPDVPYSICPMWDAVSGDFRRWYVNIESPFKRTMVGFDMVDYELDIVIAPDMSWEWKDVERLQDLVKRDVFSESQAKTFKDYGLDAVRRLEGRSAPFDEAWQEWKPDPAWGSLEMPSAVVWLSN